MAKAPEDNLFFEAVVATWEYTFFKTRSTIYLKCVHFVACELYPSELD